MRFAKWLLKSLWEVPVQKLKVVVAKVWMSYLWHAMTERKKEGKPLISSEAENQRWIHLQGQVISSGRIRWRWDKVLMRYGKEEING